MEKEEYCFYENIKDLIEEHVKRKIENFREYQESHKLIIQQNQESLMKFKALMNNNTTREEWTVFFEENNYILGYALIYKYTRIKIFDDVPHIGMDYFVDARCLSILYYSFFQRLINIYTYDSPLFDKKQIEQTISLQDKFNKTDVQDVIEEYPYSNELVGDSDLSEQDIIINKKPILIAGSDANRDFSIESNDVVFMTFDNIYDASQEGMLADKKLIDLIGK